MTIYNVIEFGESDERLPEPNNPLTWRGKTFVLVRGAKDDFAIYWQWSGEDWTPEQIAASGHKVASFKLPDSYLSDYILTGLIQEMPEGWYYRA